RARCCRGHRVGARLNCSPDGAKRNPGFFPAFRCAPCGLRHLAHQTAETVMRIVVAVAAALICVVPSACASAEEHGVLADHNDAARSGHFVVPALTWQKARTLRLDAGFAARVAGHLYAQPLTWRTPGAGTIVLTASEDNVVQAFDAHSG